MNPLRTTQRSKSCVVVWTIQELSESDAPSSVLAVSRPGAQKWEPQKSNSRVTACPDLREPCKLQAGEKDYAKRLVPTNNHRNRPRHVVPGVRARKWAESECDNWSIFNSSRFQRGESGISARRIRYTNLLTKILDFRGFESSRIINLRGGILIYIYIYMYIYIYIQTYIYIYIYI